MAGNLNTTVTGLAATGTSTWDPVTIDFTATSTASTILIQGDSPGEYIGLDDVAVSTTTNAAPPANLVANGSFEQPASPTGLPGAGTGTPLAGGSTAIAGWTVTGTSDLDWTADSASAPQSTPYGDYFLNLADNHALASADLSGAPYDGVTQTIATTPGTTYQLTFDLGNDNTTANTGVLPTGNGIAEPSGSGAMPGWTVIGGTATGNDGVAWLSNANSYGLTAETGSYFVSLAGYRDNAPYFGVDADHRDHGGTELRADILPRGGQQQRLLHRPDRCLGHRGTGDADDRERQRHGHREPMGRGNGGLHRDRGVVNDLHSGRCRATTISGWTTLRWYRPATVRQGPT